MDAARGGPAQRVLDLKADWLFGGKWTAGAMQPDFADGAFSRVALPHCVAPLSWRNWDPAAWEDVWIYRRHFDVPREMRGLRLFLHFDRVMEGARVTLNGHDLGEHLGGFLPFAYEVTNIARESDNVLAVAVDARWLNVPPSGSPRGPISVDYLLAGGITGGVSLRAVPDSFLADVFAKPVKVLDADRRLELTCTIDSGTSLPRGVLRVEGSLRDGDRILARASTTVHPEKASQVSLTLERLGDVGLWAPENPRLYDVEVTLFTGERPLHRFHTRVGFRDARFELDGFFLNGQRLQIFGLNRHEIYPYTGFAMPDRVLRRDAEMLRRQFNCNMVRCSHYPQSEAFLDGCDELGLMVWQEVPGWQYLGDARWKELVVRDTEEMIRRDRNHPAIVIWGVRVNESANDPELYERTRAAAKSLDDSRQTSGTMTPDSKKTWREAWHQDVFAFDDYHSAPDGSVGIQEPTPGVPYLIAEAVGQYDYGGKGFGRKYRRAGDLAIIRQQAVLHAQAHDRAAANPRISGVIAWCAFDYMSLLNPWETVKCPGVADLFRIPKLGASFYMAQIDPMVRPVIEPDFAWDFGPQTPSGPGDHVAIFSNCERLEIYLDAKHHASLRSDRAGFPHLRYPPFFADFGGQSATELRIEGFVADTAVLSRSFSADRAADRLVVAADDRELWADGTDATRVLFGAADQFGTLRCSGSGAVSLSIEGPGEIIGDNPFSLEDSGGVGAVWIRTLRGRAGRVRVQAKHPSLGTAGAEIRVREAGNEAVVERFSAANQASSKRRESGYGSILDHRS
ncbi:MAG TPA: glycoside hydrolase family 2 TIM barrel-domain containing protein [Acidobacteriaceae bacterium]|nr:glycoside hydrolase family 2 TIM barrel-domain containing protein [Acidobacteriaceae bacterium]